MRNWRSLYEILSFPIQVLLLAYFFLGLGNLLTNDAFGMYINIKSSLVLLLANTSIRAGTFIMVNFPLVILMRLVTRKSGSATTMLSALFGYVVFLTITMYFSRTDLPSTTYSSILGLSMTSTSTTTLQSTVRYPLQTGIAGAIITAVITLSRYGRTRMRSEYAFLSFLSRDIVCVIETVILCGVAGLAIAYVWPYVINVIQTILTFVSEDTTNPVNLIIYGIVDRVLAVLNLSTIVRTPFWYGTSGGSWISIAGTNIAGDVNIWRTQLAANSLNGMAGRFITPYYVLNIFAIPGMLVAFHTLHTDRMQRRRNIMLIILLTLISMLGGTLLPLELMLLLMSPLLFLFHITMSGVLFGLFQSMHVYLGFNYSGTNTIAALPGTLMEFITYFNYSSMQDTLLKVGIVGICMFLIYFLVTRFYFKHLALDLFHTGVRETTVKGTVQAVGGIENIKLIHSSPERLIISLYDPSKLNALQLRKLGAVKISETRAGFAIAFGSSSIMIHDGIHAYMRDNIRNV